MSRLLPDLVRHSTRCAPDAVALRYRGEALTYRRLSERMDAAANGLLAHHLGRGERVAVYLEKRFEAVIAMFGASAAGGVFVPVNPILKPLQVEHILKDCNVRVLVTSAARFETLREALTGCHDLRHVVLIDGGTSGAAPNEFEIVGWDALLAAGQDAAVAPHRVIDVDMTAILYTSGSTGKPKGVVLSHRNMVVGAESVSGYLGNTAEDRILSVLPLSFDAGLSQLTTAFNVGASVVLMNYLMARDVARLVEKERITGLTCVPPLWIQLTQTQWTDEARASIRYIANTGGVMPRATLDALRRLFTRAEVFLMYGLTEAFRSTYLPPAEVDRRPDSIGKAIPNAEILVVREDGELCGPGEPGELVHRGALVALGYWNDPERTAERFRPAPGRPGEVCVPEIAVWSGDTVRMDEEGFLYFVGRRDEMIKTSGYRVSPTEVEEVIYASGLVGEAVALGVPHPVLGQGIVIVATPAGGDELDQEGILDHCRRELPPFMVPQRVETREALPRNPNGKIDRKAMAGELAGLFREAAE